MKKRFFAGLFGLVLLAGLLMVSCGETYDYEFKNSSSITLNITSEDTDPKAFTLTPNQSKTVTSSKSSIQYVYSPASSIRVESSKGKVTFFDKTP